MRETYLDGLRGWAALIVTVGHIASGVVWPNWTPWPKPLIIDGTFSVYIFFVLSGYVLSIGFFRLGQPRLVFDLALRRYPRLTIPILVSATVAMVLIAAGWMFNVPASKAASSPWLGIYFQFSPSLVEVLKFSLWDVYFDHPPFELSYNPPLWTMPVEMQGSILVFCALLFMGRSRWRRLVAHAAFLSVTSWLSSPFFGMAIGVTIAQWVSSKQFDHLAEANAARTATWGLFALALTVASIRAADTMPVLLSICASAVLVSILLNRYLQRLLDLPISQWLGRISFSLYLVHHLVICSFSSWAYLKLSPGQGLTSLQSAGLFIASLIISLIAAAAFRPIETAGIRAGRRLSHWVLGPIAAARAVAK